MGIFGDNGYIIFPKVVPDNLCQAVVEDILEHTKDGKECVFSGGTVEMYHYQSMWDVRQYLEVYETFRNVLGTDKLWVSIDRTGLKAAVSEAGEAKSTNMQVHWDTNINQRPRPVEVQGIVALTDTSEDMGGFECVPSLYKELDEWIDSLPTKKAVYSSLNTYGGKCSEYVPMEIEGNNKREAKSWDVKKVPMKAGDLLIYDSFLPHANGVNLSKKPRFAQYVSMFPVGDERLRLERIECWKSNSAPSGWAFFGDFRGIERKRPTANLTSLGNKLLGIERW